MNNLENIENFFNFDLRIKKQIMDLKQDYAYQLTGDYLEKYIKEIYTTINDMEENFIKIANDFNFGNIISLILYIITFISWLFIIIKRYRKSDN